MKIHSLKKNGKKDLKMNKWLLYGLFLLFCFGCNSTPQKGGGGSKSPFPEWSVEFVKQKLGTPEEETSDGVKKILKYHAIQFFYDEDTDDLMTVQFIHPKFRQELIKTGDVFLQILPPELSFSQSPEHVEVAFGRRADQISRSTRLRETVHLHYFYAINSEDNPEKADWRNFALRFASKKLEMISVGLLSPEDETFGVQ